MKTRKWVIKLIALTLLFTILLGSSALAGWQNDGGKWWYSYGNGGYARNNWVQDGNAWYYFGDDGYMVTGWQKIGSWYHFDNNGVMNTGWFSEGGKWYFLGTDGAMKTGWVKAGNNWYYMEADGVMCTGWKKIGGSWYYFSGGAMVTGLKTIDGKAYQFTSEGKLIETVYPVISSINLTKNSIGYPVVYIQIYNQTNSIIDRVDFTVYCYDAYGRQIKGYGYYTHDEDWYDGVIMPGESSPAGHYWNLYGYDGVRTVLVTITKYHTTDGRTVNIPKSQQITFRN
jgi:hypothetical protein